MKQEKANLSAGGKIADERDPICDGVEVLDRERHLGLLRKGDEMEVGVC